MLGGFQGCLVQFLRLKRDKRIVKHYSPASMSVQLCGYAPLGPSALAVIFVMKLRLGTKSEVI